MPLETLLREELAAVEALHDLLRQEHDALRARDAPTLERLAGEKQACADGLRGLETRRLNLLRERGLPTEPPGWTTALAAAAPAERASLAELMTALEHAAAQARDQNDLNGAIIAASRNHIEQALTILSGRDPLDCLYGHDTRRVFGNDTTPIAKA